MDTRYEVSKKFNIYIYITSYIYINIIFMYRFSMTA